MMLTLAGLVVARAGRTIAGPIELSIAAGEAVRLTGPNGAGKTTLLRTIAGFLPAAAGRIELGGDRAEPGEVAHFIGHQNALKERLTVAENARFWQRYLGAAAMGLVDAIAAVGLSGLEDAPAGYLSAGQRRRLALARLLVAARPVWLLDEPTAALDADGHSLVTRLIDSHCATGGIALVATHDALPLANARTLALAPAGPGP